MRLPDFELEVFFGRYEFSTPYLLAQSDCESLSIGALLALEPDPEKARHEFLQTRLGYSPNDGSPALRQALRTAASCVSSNPASNRLPSGTSALAKSGASSISAWSTGGNNGFARIASRSRYAFTAATSPACQSCIV